MSQQFAAHCNDASIVGNDNVNDEKYLGGIKNHQDCCGGRNLLSHGRTNESRLVCPHRIAGVRWSTTAATADRQGP
jgi:hypothetical protein